MTAIPRARAPIRRPVAKVAQKIEDVRDKANDLKHNVQAAADKLKG